MASRINAERERPSRATRSSSRRNRSDVNWTKVCVRATDHMVSNGWMRGTKHQAAGPPAFTPPIVETSPTLGTGLLELAGDFFVKDDVAPAIQGFDRFDAGGFDV